MAEGEATSAQSEGDRHPMEVALAQAADLTCLEGDGVAKVGAVQLPGDAQLPLRGDQIVLLASFALAHDKLLAVQAHCMGMAPSQMLP